MLEWLVDRVVSLTPERRQEVTDELFHEGAEFRSYLYRFAILQSLAVLIATFGLISDSVAVVDRGHAGCAAHEPRVGRGGGDGLRVAGAPG